MQAFSWWITDYWLNRENRYAKRPVFCPVNGNWIHRHWNWNLKISKKL
jgi:hypothetical protein